MDCEFINQQIYVIMMSAHGTIATAVRATQLGAIEFMEKPFSSESWNAIR